MFDKVYVSAPTKTNRLPRGKVPVLAIISILVVQALAASIIGSAYAFFPISPADVVFHFDYDSAKGFEKVVRNVGTPEFVLGRGLMGTFTVTLISREKEPVLAILRYGGEAVTNYRGWGELKNVPDGIIYSIVPDRLTLAPNSSSTVTVRIAATANTMLRSYDLGFYLHLENENGTINEGGGHSTVLTIVEGISSSPTNTTNTVKGTTSYVTQTNTLTSATTTTVTTLIERVADPSVYTWAVGATAITAILAVVLLRKRRS